MKGNAGKIWQTTKGAKLVKRIPRYAPYMSASKFKNTGLSTFCFICRLLLILWRLVNIFKWLPPNQRHEGYNKDFNLGTRKIKRKSETKQFIQRDYGLENTIGKTNQLATPQCSPNHILHPRFHLLDDPTVLLSQIHNELTPWIKGTTMHLPFDNIEIPVLFVYYSP